MKRLIFILVLLFFAFAINTQAQSDSGNDFEYVFKKGIIGIYAGPYFRNTKIDGNWTDISGGGGGIYFYNRFFIAGNSYGQWEPGKSKTLPGKEIKVTMNGVCIGVNSNPKEMIHFNGSIYFGAGEATIIDETDKKEFGKMNLMYLDPMIDVEVNVYEAFRFFIGTEYRFAFSKDKISNLDAGKFSGFSIFWGIKTGLF